LPSAGALVLKSYRLAATVIGYNYVLNNSTELEDTHLQKVVTSTVWQFSCWTDMDLCWRNQSQRRVGVAGCAPHVGESLGRREIITSAEEEARGSPSENRIISVQLEDGPQPRSQCS
jgi:hypothetical protein